jgi:hypothetical protein
LRLNPNDEIYVHIIDMEYGITEQVVKNEDNTYSVFLNARYSYEYHLWAYRHALKHINEKDFEEFDTQSIEHKTHEL